MAEGALSAHHYLDRLLDALAQGAETVLAERLVFHAGDRTGEAWATFVYPGGFLLHAAVTVNCGHGAPLWEDYSFHLVGSAGRLVICCDNSRHHPAVGTFPHHRHVGSAEEVQPSQEPTVRTVVAEIARVVRNAGTGGL